MGNEDKENQHDHHDHEHGEEHDHHDHGHHDHEHGEGHEHHDHGHHDHEHGEEHEHHEHEHSEEHEHHEHGHHDHGEGHEHHDHDHEHGEEHEHLGTDGDINFSRHEGALICSTQFVVNLAYNQTVKAVEGALNELAAWVDDNKGYTGHIKASVNETGRSSSISNTGDGVVIKEFTDNKTAIVMASIIFSVPEHEYCEKFEAIIESLKALTV